MISAARNLVLMLAVASVASCSWFGGDDDEAFEPMKLTDIVTSVSIKRIWRVKIGRDAEFLRVALQPSGDGNRLYAASRDGNVVALRPKTGKEIWRTDLDLELSAGPGVGNGLAVVAAADGFVIALDAGSGAEMWRADVSGEVLAKPVIKGDFVIVQTIDNRLLTLSVFDGTQRWVVEQTTPRLTMRGSATPVVVGSLVIAGFDNGRLIAVKLDSGDIEWETVLSPPSGRSDLERLADIDGAISVVERDVYASGYQGALVALASESGQILWTREISSFEGVSADWNNLYTVDQEGALVALTRRTGVEVWRQTSLLRREPTLPVPFQTTVVVGDLDGYLHFFSNFDGRPVARLKVDGKAISGDPVVVADQLFVQSDSGSVSAYVMQRPRRTDKSSETSDEGA